MTTLLLDTSVVLKWFHHEGESEVLAARALRDAHVLGQVEARVIDLGLYEVGNVLVRSLSWSGPDVADQLDDLVAILGDPLVLTQEVLREAALLAEEHRLSFYDAAWAAAARSWDVALVSADRRLCDTGLAESPTACARRLGRVP